MKEAFSQFAQQILEERYLLRDKHQKLSETPDQLFWRVASAVAEGERRWGGHASVRAYSRDFYSLMKDLFFLPNSPTLMNAGTASQNLSACFVFPVEDSMEGIFGTLQRAALVHQHGGGTGFNFSAIRPAGDMVRGRLGTAFGPMYVIALYNRATEMIKQGGRRRGANMGILNVDHPDIFSFISSKSQGSRLGNFNLSVGITDRFMRAVENDSGWDLVNPRDHQSTQRVNARHLWKEIVWNAWNCGDPGLVFLDTINRHNPTPQAGAMVSTNPCGEVPLLPNESCNLGSINVSKMVETRGRKTEVNWQNLMRVVELGVRFLDNVIEVNQYCDEAIQSATLANRKIGLGVMGWADLLIKLNIPYASLEAVRLGEKLMEFISITSKNASAMLAMERGNFPNWERSSFFPAEPMRNATRNSIAPTGTISIIAQTSASIEPIFALAYHRKVAGDGPSIPLIHPLFLEHLRTQRLDARKILSQVIKTGTCAEIRALGMEARNLFKTALEMDSDWHIRHQVAFQRFTDNAVSKTINLPEDASVAQVESVLMQAWKLELKGITVFRNNSKQEQVLYPGLGGELDYCRACQQFAVGRAMKI
jgi:ribonucleoside-diphosphate reductase alpha chain